jgi:hypothetical protein
LGRDNIYQQRLYGKRRIGKERGSGIGVVLFDMRGFIPSSILHSLGAFLQLSETFECLVRLLV